MRSPIPDLPLYIDSTMLNTYRACRKKFEYNFLHNLRPPGRSVHLVAGGAFAAGIDAARSYYYTTPNPSFDTMLERAMAAYIKEWGDYTAPEGHAKSFHNTFHALEQYFVHHHPSTDSIQPLRKADGSPTTEFSFAIPLPILHPSGDPFIYCGRFDMLGKWDDLLTILDEKTSSALGAFWLSQWSLRGQFLGYCWACQQLGYPVRQVAIRGVGILKTEIKFLTALEQYPQYLIDRWYSQLLITLSEMVEFHKNSYFDYNFGDSCSAYGGCTYKQLCEASEPEAWMSNFEVRKWNPVLREEQQPE